MEIIVIIKKRDTLLYTAKKDEINAIKIEYDYRKE